jgi:hypothetical protein
MGFALRPSVQFYFFKSVAFKRKLVNCTERRICWKPEA